MEFFSVPMQVMFLLLRASLVCSNPSCAIYYLSEMLFSFPMIIYLASTKEGWAESGSQFEGTVNPSCREAWCREHETAAHGDAVVRKQREMVWMQHPSSFFMPSMDLTTVTNPI